MSKTDIIIAKKQEVLARVREWLQFAPLDDDTHISFCESQSITAISDYTQTTFYITLSNSNNEQLDNEKSQTDNG